MTKLPFFLLLLFCALGASAQQISLNGRVVDSLSGIPLESATVYLESAKDSTMIDYTLTGKDGGFSLRTRKMDKPVVLKFSYMGYRTRAIVKQTLSGDLDLGNVFLTDEPNLLGEVIIKTEIPPVRIKNDTLEFNAASFKLRPDANVEALVKQLPGVEIDVDGKITVNGKEVKQILVNGKPFFDENGKIALQNLPAELINKVQITDLKTKKEELSKQAATSNDASLNLTIDEKKNKGFFGKAMAGAGSDKRYESSLIANYFKGAQKVSVLASSNNINASGFSMNEVFDAMGGGRNSSLYMMDNGAFAINNMYFGSDTGITQNHIIGANYADEWFKDFESAFNYFYIESHTKNNNRTNLTTFLPQGSFETSSQAKFRDDKVANNFSFRVEYKIDSTAVLYFEPRFSKAVTRQNNLYESLTQDQNGRLTNRSDSQNDQEFENLNFKNSVNFNKALAKKGRAYSAELHTEIRDNTRDRLFKSTSEFYDDQDDDGTTDDTRIDIRDQRFDHFDGFQTHTASVDFTEPLRDSLRLTIGLRYRTSSSENRREVFDFDPATGGYTSVSDLLTNRWQSRENRTTPFSRLEVIGKRYNFQVSGGADVIDFSADAAYLGETARVSRQFTAPEVNSTFNYKFSQSKGLYLNYGYRVNLPWTPQLLPIVDLSDPLSTTVGNPDLDATRRHSFYASFRNYSHSTKSGFSFYGGGGYSDRVVVSLTSFAPTGERSTTYVNLDGVFNSWFGYQWSRSKKVEAHSFRYSFGINGGYDRNKGFTNGQLYDAKSLRITPQTSFTYDYGKPLSVNPSYSLTSYSTRYENYVVDRLSNVRHRANLILTSYWPKHVVFGNDFTYTYNSNIADGFRKDFFLWNISLGYNFLNDKLLAKVKVYDVLDRNQNTTRTITATSVRDEENDVLKRYVMFSLAFKLDKFAGKDMKR